MDTAVVGSVELKPGSSATAGQPGDSVNLRLRRRARAVPVWGWLLVVGALLIGLALIFAVEPVRVSSNSMSPTFAAGDQVLIDKVTSRAHHPRRRDIVTFHIPGSHEQLIKRVVGVAGDTVGLEDGVLVVNGAHLTESFVDYSQMDATYFGPVTVPAGMVFLLGDNRANSVDSRTFGPVPVKAVTGRVLTRIGPGHA